MENRLPLIEIENLFSLDPFGKKIWKYYLGPSKFAEYKNKFELFGLHGALAVPYSQAADRHEPMHVPYNRVEEKEDRISYHPSYQVLRELSYGAGIISQKYKGSLVGQDKFIRHMVGFASAYYFAQTETGLFCPICMTDALGRVLELHAKDPVSKEVLRRLQSEDLNEIWEGAMFLTERQGGSDVGANEVKAWEEEPGRWKVYGEKWFCSNADAGAILVLARIIDKNSQTGEEKILAPGTKGLGLFLLTRNIPQDNQKNWSIKRLKSKLGVRSMASAEIELQGAQATLIGGVGEGFKMMTDMVNMSRIYNSVASLAIARRSILEAHLFAKKRHAFGLTLHDLPLYRQSLAELQTEFITLQFLIFEAIRQMDAFDQGDQNAGKILRVLTPLCKALSGKMAVFATAEGMELIGGNAYIEEHILPRLYRDAQVLPIWEGTTQIQSLDLLRIFSKEGFASIHAKIEEVLSHEYDVVLQLKLQDNKQKILRQIQTLQQDQPEIQQRKSRHVLETLGRFLSQIFVYEALGDLELKPVLSSVLHYSLGRDYLTQPLGTSEYIAEEGERHLLTSIS